MPLRSPHSGHHEFYTCCPGVLECRQTEVTLTGGYLYPRLGIQFARFGERMLHSISADVAILGIRGITQDGVSDSSPLVVASIRAMIECAQRVVIRCRPYEIRQKRNDPRGGSHGTRSDYYRPEPGSGPTSNFWTNAVSATCWLRTARLLGAESIHYRIGDGLHQQFQIRFHWLASVAVAGARCERDGARHLKIGKLALFHP